MTDWDPATIDTDSRTAKGAFVALACAVVWLICAPHQIYSRLRERAQRNSLSDGADMHGAVEGGQQFHNGGNV